jgi:AraC-like DNA-binding protein
MAHGFTDSPWQDLSSAEPDDDTGATSPKRAAPVFSSSSPNVRPHPTPEAQPLLPDRSDDEEQATATLIATKLITLCRSAGAGDAGLASFLDDLLAAVTARLDRIDEHGSAPPHRLAPWQESAAKKLMTQDLSCPPTLQALAAACGLSSNGFARAFRGSTGLSPRQWLISFRIARAQEMLADTAVPLSTIALDCGFCDQSHFTRTFTQMAGTTPAVWRREARHRGSSAPGPSAEQGTRKTLVCAAE